MFITLFPSLLLFRKLFCNFSLSDHQKIVKIKSWLLLFTFTILLLYPLAHELSTRENYDQWTPKPPSNIRISRRIFVRRISAEKNPASRIRRRIFAAVNPPKKFGYPNKNWSFFLCECDLAEMILNNLNCVDRLRYFDWYTNIDFMHYTVLRCSAS